MMGMSNRWAITSSLTRGSRTRSSQPSVDTPAPAFDSLAYPAHSRGVFHTIIETTTGLHLPALQARVPCDTVPLHRVGRRPGGLLRDPDGGNVRLTRVRLGKGTRGEVVLCFNERTRLLMVAKKTSITQASPASVAYEAQAYLHGRSVLAPFAVLLGPKKTYLLQALCPGNVQNLLDRLGSQERDAVRLGLGLLAGRQTLTALDALHMQGWGHRDVKPDNMLFVNDDIILADYDRVAHHDVADMMPTLWYAPPEVFGLAPATGLLKVDIWSLGASMLQIACGYDERMLPLRKKVSAIVATLVRSKKLPRDGVFEKCYASCSSPHSYEPVEKLTQAIVLRALMLVHHQMLEGHAGPPAPLARTDEQTDLPWRQSPEDDPIRLIPEALRQAIQACILQAMHELPLPLRTIVHQMLQPDPTLRPDAKTLRHQLDDTWLDVICEVNTSKSLLNRESAHMAQKIQARLLPEIHPTFVKRVRRLFMR